MAKKNLQAKLKQARQTIKVQKRKIEQLEAEIRGDSRHMIDFVGGLAQFGAAVLDWAVERHNLKVKYSMPVRGTEEQDILLWEALRIGLVRKEGDLYVIQMDTGSEGDPAVDITSTR